MSSIIEKLEARLKHNDDKIKELEKDIKDYDDMIKRGEPLTEDQKGLHDNWRKDLELLFKIDSELNQQITELSKSRPGDAQAISALAEKVDKLVLEQQLQKATSTTTRVEVYADFESKGLISTFKPEDHLNQLQEFKTNKWTSSLRVRVYFT